MSVYISIQSCIYKYDKAKVVCLDYSANHFYYFYCALSKCKSQNDIWQLLKGEIQALGATWVNYAHGDVENLIFLSSMNESWLTYYFENYVAGDFLVDHCQSSHLLLPIDVTEFTSAERLTRPNRDMTRDIFDLGSRYMVCIPLPSSRPGTVAGACIHFDLPKQEVEAILAAHHTHFTMILQAAHQAFMLQALEVSSEIYFSQEGRQIAAKQLLTQREKDVLLFLMQGFRADRISERMGLSVPTIHMHIQKARRRLNAKTREEAIAKAITYRHITI